MTATVGRTSHIRMFNERKHSCVRVIHFQVIHLFEVQSDTTRKIDKILKSYEGRLLRGTCFLYITNPSFMLRQFAPNFNISFFFFLGILPAGGLNPRIWLSNHTLVAGLAFCDSDHSTEFYRAVRNYRREFKMLQKCFCPRRVLASGQKLEEAFQDSPRVYI